MKGFFDALKHPWKIIVKLDNHRIIRLSDEKYIKYVYKHKIGKKLNLNNPQTFNEKLQWLKLNNRNDLYTIMVDKYEVKNYIANIIGNEYVIPTIGIYNSFDEIDFEKLPSQFVIKCTHDSGGIVICKDKSKFDIKKAKKIINKFLKRKYFYVYREWPYKNVKPRIIVEQYMEDENYNELKDYKLFCFNGIPKIFLVCSERFSSNNMCETWFNENWELLSLIENKHRIDKNINKPLNFERMKEYASKIAKDMPFVRVDFYEIRKKIYFGEITFYPASGYEKFEPKEWDKKLGDMIKLPIDK